MNKDTYKLVTEYPVMEYRCGARAGNHVRLRRDFIVCDHRGKPTDEVHRAGKIWTVHRGAVGTPPVIWLEQPDGAPDTSSEDDNFLATFEILR